MKQGKTKQQLSLLQLITTWQSIFLVICLSTLLGCSQTDNEQRIETKKKAKIGREDTVIFDHEGGPIPDPHNLNPLVPSPTGPGMRQSCWEPLFILNYETCLLYTSPSPRDS